MFTTGERDAGTAHAPGKSLPCACSHLSSSTFWRAVAAPFDPSNVLLFNSAFLVSVGQEGAWGVQLLRLFEVNQGLLVMMERHRGRLLEIAFSVPPVWLRRARPQRSAWRWTAQGTAL